MNFSRGGMCEVNRCLLGGGDPDYEHDLNHDGDYTILNGIIPLYSRLYDRQKSDVRQNHRLMPPPIRGGA